MPVPSPTPAPFRASASIGRIIAPRPVRPSAYGPWVAMAWAAGLFCAVVLGVIVFQRLHAANNDPWKSPQLLALKQQLLEHPRDETLKEQIRELDLKFRQRYVRRLKLTATGGWLAVAGAAVALLAARRAAALMLLPPMPKPNPDASRLAALLASRSRWSVAAAGLVLGAAVLAVGLSTRTPLPATPEEVKRLLAGGDAAEDAGGVPALPTLEELAANWPRFRGWDGGGVCRDTNLPLTWDVAGGVNLFWKAAAPALAPSSPVVWSNRIFFTGGDAAKREVFCHDAATGQLLWQRAVENVPGSPATQPAIPKETTFAASTGATDGRRIFAIFGNGDLAALSFDGAPVWSKNLGVPKNPYGYATSLGLWPGKLLVQLDQAAGAPGGSKLLCLDAATGRALWERARQTEATWATPTVIEAAGKTQVITLGLPHVVSYALADGNELWRADVLEGEITPSPVFAGGLVLAVSPSIHLVALRPDGAGDVTKSHLAWSVEDNQPDVTSPVASGELAFTVTSSGTLTCFDLKDGSKQWEHELEMEVQASPSLVGNRVFVLGTKGVAVTVDAARQFQEVSRSALPDHFLASPAFAGGKMFLRGATNLWCVAAGPGKGGEK